MQTMQIIFNFTDILVLYVFAIQNLETFGISHTFLPITVAKLSTLKTVQFFGPPCYLLYCVCTVLQLHVSWSSIAVDIDINKYHRT